MHPITHKFYLSSPMKTPPPPHSSHTSFPIIAVAIIGILATAFLLVGYYIFVIKCCLSWHRIDLLRRFSFSRRRVNPPPPHSPVQLNRGLNEAQIRSIPIFNFNKTQNQKLPTAHSTECSVCLTEFQEQEKLRIIPNCAHVFHIDCIDIWLQNNANCPLCRTSISETRPETQFQIDPDPVLELGTDRDEDEDYVVIEISRPGSSLTQIPEDSNLSSNEVLSKGKKFGHVASMGDECIDNRRKDEQFIVQTKRRSFSMDSAVDSQLYLAVQDILQQVNFNEDLSSSSSGNNRGKRSFFSRGSRSAIQPLGIEP